LLAEFAQGIEESPHNYNTDMTIQGTGNITMRTEYHQLTRTTALSREKFWSLKRTIGRILRLNYNCSLVTQSHCAIMCNNRNQRTTQSTLSHEIVESCHQTLSKRFCMFSLSNQLFNSP